MGGLTPSAALDRGIEATLRRDRALVAASLAAVVALAWVYLWLDAEAMAGMDMTGMPAHEMHLMSASSFGLTFAMWAIMMAGMMLPSAAPAILLYAALLRKNVERGSVLPATWIFAGGYLVLWAAFSLGATALQFGLALTMLLTPMMAVSSTALSAAILIAAGVYQWLPLKQACLQKCRNPMQFLMMRWRPGPSGAFRMGAEHGAYCVGCCWALMLLLFVAGVMNLLWVALIAAFVFVEKLLPASRFTSSLAAIVLAAAGLVLLLGMQ